ncbi:MAG TPA: nucleoside-diphosphate kinase [Candidatus Saccharimonadia bacterium]|nr:nucleoside-diphosphate kinase [Candidatus Saccharimonadia bacterium]
MEQTLIVVKPDGVQRSLVGRLLQRFEDAGLKIVGMKMVWIDDNFAKKHYFDLAERRGEHVLKNMVDLMTEGPVVAVVLEGVEAVENVRRIVGSTEPKSAAPGTIRGDFAHHSFSYTDEKQQGIRNLIHASGNVAEAKQEVELWFEDGELHGYRTDQDKHHGF